ncbi:DUF58 domain-containing protein [Halovulum dunhuangense]|uniref:DUF58 domain-containing protein n=1 Tax=Halovulum dunhuangense TaxID=1505036 RepID=A0A849L0Z4_9RHOB|nr:DUF58 domain-containing protein [Halovulum dunhuangense]NNU79933.1 DUF58 domain-containing protein [Halovulum dunhuangense]
MRPAPALLDRLSRRRLIPRVAPASRGIGERRSRQKGPGLEFMEHRPYQPGDDLRHLDPHLYARLGEAHIREYEVYRQLPVTILIDASASMLIGDRRRHRHALELAALLGHVALAGGDQLRFAVAGQGRLDWSPLFQTPSCVDRALDWLDRAPAPGGDLGDCLPAAARRIEGRGLTLLLSDWWDIADLPRPLVRRLGAELWAVQIATPEDTDPALLPQGDLRLADPETGATVDLVLDAAVCERFRRTAQAFRDDLRARIEGAGGRYLPVSTATPLHDLLLRDWPALGVIA